ncbi:hypothetical protein [Streptomyces sp. NPDC058614]|uniref:DUF7427 family protein n=1 Tax=Streptomyces sp. NPDC058614 TaxID=3346557 RepID=UPI003660B6B7
MTTADQLWGTLLLIVVAYEIYILGNVESGGTLSERVRAWLRVHTRPGRALFAIGWTGFTVWLLLHILTE